MLLKSLIMKTKVFLELLQSHSSKSLNFEYRSGRRLKPGYHITEVKHVSIDSVDCGSRRENWNETVVQLWENPEEVTASNPMSAYKARGILKKVGGLRPYDDDAVIKFEYGNLNFHTAQLLVHSFEVTDDELIIKLHADQTDCKAKGACGIAEAVESAAAASACCSPDGQCC